ncbi:MAG TPA: UPF0280 family protein [Terriglobales bacterium]|jgi:hypothetical protein
MTGRAQIRLLPGGHRLHMNDGPIDLIVEAFGAPSQVRAAYEAAGSRFATLLDELCSELRSLRRQAGTFAPNLKGRVARRMANAVAPYALRTFITPMAAVAGAVAEEILETMTLAATLFRAYVNDGGDIALHLAPGSRFVVGMVERPDRASLFGTTTVGSGDPVRGIATSGWRGRSFSLGIADAVTVLADRASQADAAATIIANAVDLPGHPAIFRAPARSLDPDNDLGDLLVTQGVGELTTDDVTAALEAGAATARLLLSEGLIRAAALSLQGETRIVRCAPETSLKTPQSSRAHRSLVHA